MIRVIKHFNDLSSENKMNMQFADLMQSVVFKNPGQNDTKCFDNPDQNQLVSGKLYLIVFPMHTFGK